MTTYRADPVGSFLRPSELLEARAAHTDGRCTDERLGEVEDRAVLRILDVQRQVPRAAVLAPRVDLLVPDGDAARMRAARRRDLVLHAVAGKDPDPSSACSYGPRNRRRRHSLPTSLSVDTERHSVRRFCD